MLHIIEILFFKVHFNVIIRLPAMSITIILFPYNYFIDQSTEWNTPKWG